MPNKMLIDATHPEETRVVVLRGNRVEEFDFESATRKQLRGNIYLAKVTRVEPSLQAAFVDYGGNRHGFLAFGEIHPDYYQIPVADRQALIDEEERAARAAELEADNRARHRAQRERRADRRHEQVRSAPVEPPDEEAPAMAAASEMMAPAADATHAADAADPDAAAPTGFADEPFVSAPEPSPESTATEGDAPTSELPPSEESAPGSAEPTVEPDVMAADASAEAAAEDEEPRAEESADFAEGEPAAAADSATTEDNVTEINGPSGGEEEPVESVGGADAMEEVPERMSRVRRQYKIQEVIKRRQVMLVQVVKEERGTKGAALTTYLSLAGRYSVLMPNTARGGGISRKITDPTDRKRLKEVAQELEVPEGMGVILRTAGASRTKTEIKRDFEYLLRLWETVRDLTLRSTAPTLVYEEGSLVKRSIRDLYNKDIDEIQVSGEAAYKDARDFMRMLMPTHAKNVKPYRDNVPMFARFGIESQLDAMFQPVVQLRSGGYIVLNQAEALVAIDVNSGRATREHHIEDTALKTNLEAAEEIARQLRLRDLAGLIVIDFIDMDEKRNNRTVERRLKEALKHDRARIQVGHISHFGLLEMSRQRIRSSVLESSTEKCPHCGGTGHVRSVSSVALQLLRAIEEMLLKGGTHNLIVRTRSETALYLLNHKRAHLRELEDRFQLTITVNADPTVAGQVSYVIEKGEQVHSLEQAKALVAMQPAGPAAVAEEDDEVVEEGEEGEAAEIGTSAGAEEHAGEATSGERNGRRRRRRRRGRRGGEDREAEAPEAGAASITAADEEEHEIVGAEAESEAEFGAHAAAGEPHGDGDKRRRRRGRRGGRRSRHGHEDQGGQPADDAIPAFEAEPGIIGEYVATEAGELPRPAHEPDLHQAEPRLEEHAAEPAVAAAPLEPAAPEVKPRRGSTVREAAPTSFSFSGEPRAAEPPPAALPEPEEPPAGDAPSEEEARPRRGWWSKRVLGKG
jgi:ribonuclease E